MNNLIDRPLKVFIIGDSLEQVASIKLKIMKLKFNVFFITAFDKPSFEEKINWIKVDLAIVGSDLVSFGYEGFSLLNYLHKKLSEILIVSANQNQESKTTTKDISMYNFNEKLLKVNFDSLPLLFNAFLKVKGHSININDKKRIKKLKQKMLVQKILELIKRPHQNFRITEQ